MDDQDLMDRYLHLKKLAERIASGDYKHPWRPADVIGVTQTLMLIDAIKDR